MENQMLIWGTGFIYNIHLNLIKYMERDGFFTIRAVVSDTAKYESLDGYRVIRKSEVGNEEYDFIFVMSDTYFEEILTEAVSMGVPREKILPYTILDAPYLDFRKYVELKNSNIAIISNNCWGGVAYHSLGMECLSPFKNLFLVDDDYLKLLMNITYYLSLPLEFERYSGPFSQQECYPIMRLGDIYVHCNHDKDPEKAIEKWNRRIKKVNYNNLFIEMYTCNKEIALKFTELEYENKVCFVPFEAVHKDMIQLEMYPDQNAFWEVVLSNATFGRNSGAYNLVDLLLGEKNIRRV